MKNELTITRIFDASVELVWKSWTEEELITHWWGPQGFITKVKEHDFRPGGRWEYVMIDEKGNEYPAVGFFKEIVKHKKITSSDDFGDDFKSQTKMDLPNILLFTALFEDIGDRTKLTLIYKHPTELDRIKHEKLGVITGWNSSLDKLQKFMQIKVS
ncbi:MAG: SRPBCC domain-containing protein [Bacteroidia bacterium]|nr:SRPBCC domain-containing protein [Bacteroidia bacterium]